MEAILLAAGLLFSLAAAVGFVRWQDLFCRLHITSIIDTLGAPLILMAVAAEQGWSLTTFKIGLMIVYLYLTAPLIGHLLARAALEDGTIPWLVDAVDELAPPVETSPAGEPKP